MCQQLLKELEIEPYFSYTVAEMEAHAEKTARRMFEDMCQQALMGGGISSIKSRKTHYVTAWELSQADE